MKGSKYFGGEYDKLRHLTELNWDVLVIDEAHEGVDTYKTDLAFDRIRRKFTLHLSGTPFKALANDKFAGDAIFNWTYADEQAAKRNWQGAPGQQNPYANLPMLNLYTYQMSEIIRDEIQQGVEIDGETQEFAFDLNEFFKVKPSGSFEHEAEVDRFLDAMTTQNKFPFSTPELRAELKHTFWLLNRVDSARALAKKLQAHPVFRDYEVILAAGDGKLDDTDENQKSFDRVKAAIAHHEKTITLSVGQLTTGVTIPEWSAVLMLSNLKSPALYMQAAFRAQNPCLFHENGTFRRKENAYVFDFDPARTLLIYEQFANDLSQDTASGKGDTEERKAHIQNLLNFFPVIGEDEEGEMIPLDAEKVLSIPRKIKSKEVVRMGFQSNFLFQNISNVFSAPQEVLDILQNFQPISEAKAKPIQITPDTGADLSLNDKGEVDLDEGYVIGKAADVFGAKIYESTPALDTALQDLFYPQLGVKLCSMAGGGVQKIYMVFLREPSRRDRSGSDLFHLRDGFEIKMNFDRNVSCFIFVNALILHIRIVQGCAFSVKTDGLYDVLAVGQDVVCDSPGKQRVTLEYGQAVPYALTDTAFLGGFQPRLDFLNALGRLHGVHGVF